ncbi:MAG: SCO1664 family protein [Actinomycetes bacterium]
MSVTLDDLTHGELEVVGQLIDASNGSLLCRLTAGDERPLVIYKPRAGERPLWDFPDGTLSQREVAAFVVAQTLGWTIVPPTVWREGPAGPGMAQLWIDVDESVDLVALVQSDHDALRRIAVFDALINNGDRKGGHLLPTVDGTVWGIDHGVTFAVDDKLRTVLWQWRGAPIPEPLIAELRSWLDRVTSGEPEVAVLHQLLTDEEVAVLLGRGQRLVGEGLHPQPSPDWPAIPWPPF